MKLEIFTNANDLHPTIEEFLRRNEIVNNMGIGILSHLCSESNSYKNYKVFQILDDAKNIVGYAHHTPPHPFCLVTESFEACDVFADYISTTIENYSGFQGLKRNVDYIIRKIPNLPIANRDEQGLYTLENVIPPQAIAGELIPAKKEYIDSFLIDWTKAFCIDCSIACDTDSAIRINLEEKIQRNDLFLWKNGSEIQGTAALGRVLSKGRSVGFVYTPPHFRGMGVASNTVAALSQLALDQGNEYLCLFTQMKNKTSNKIYTEIGYQFLENFEFVSFK